MKDYLTGLLDADPSSPSIMRFAFLFSVVISNLMVWGTWLFLCILECKLINIPQGVVEIYGIANGVAFVGKSLQSFAERPKYKYMSNPNSNLVTPTAKSEVDVL